MRRVLVVFIISLLLSNSVCAQLNLVTTLQEYAKRHAEGTTLVFFDLHWCSGARSQQDAIHAFFDKMDECYTVVLVTTDYQKSFYLNLEIDTVINVADYFKKGLVKSEIKVLARQINEVYFLNLPFQNFGPASFHFFKEHAYLSTINNLYKEEDKQMYYCQ